MLCSVVIVESQISDIENKEKLSPSELAESAEQLLSVLGERDLPWQGLLEPYEKALEGIKKDKAVPQDMKGRLALLGEEFAKRAKASE